MTSIAQGTMEPQLIPCRGRARVWSGTALVADTTAAQITGLPEVDAQIFIPAPDVRMDLLSECAGPAPATRFFAVAGGDGAPIAWQPQAGGGAGQSLIGFDPAQARIEIEERWPGGDPQAFTINRFPRWGDINDLLRLIDLEPAGEDLFVGPSYGDKRRNVVEGSQLLGQAIVAASKTLPEQRVVSAHMIFARPAVFHLPLTFQVERQRLGRSFSTLGVRATQEGKFIASALVLTDKGAPDKIRGHVAMPVLPGPSGSEFYDYGMTGRDVRFVNGDYSTDPDRIGPPELHAWVRHREAPAPLYLQQAMLAQFTGHMTIGAAMLPHKGMSEAQAHVTLSTGILAITIALHEDADLRQWLLYSNPAIYAGRGLAQGEGHVFTEDGRLAASYTVQAMIRDFERDPKVYGLDSSRLM